MSFLSLGLMGERKKQTNGLESKDGRADEALEHGVYKR